jgi:hypothetical protein
VTYPSASHRTGTSAAAAASDRDAASVDPNWLAFWMRVLELDAQDREIDRRAAEACEAEH